MSSFHAPPGEMALKRALTAGFTLIELSIVLVIIGLVVGGVLVGQTLIAAAGVRATIAQIEKYNTAANTFRDKYGYLPGDIPNSAAIMFGFQPRAADWCNGAGEGDGNGIITGVSRGNGCAMEGLVQNGEPLMFWVDLSTANLIDQTFNTATDYPLSSSITATTTPSLNNYFPTAKLGQGNYVVVWSGGLNTTFNNLGDSRNYFTITGISSLLLQQDWSTVYPPVMGLTVAQAYAIDSKIDDGLPQTGNVTDIAPWGIHACAAGEAFCGSLLSTGATPGSSTTCFDNSSAASGTPGVAGVAQHYSLEISNGSNVNCALSFRMQAGD